MLYGLGSAAVAAGGVALMVVTGGTAGLVAGGIILGGGLSAEVNTITQSLSDSEDFNDK